MLLFDKLIRLELVEDSQTLSSSTSVGLDTG